MSERKLGDFNNDGMVNGADGTAINTYINKVSMCEDPGEVTPEDIAAGDVLHIDRVIRQDATAIFRAYATDSVSVRIYPKVEPSNWNDPTDPDGYKKYYYVDSEGHEVSLAEEQAAPGWLDKTYFYKGSNAELLGGDYVPPLVTHLP